MLARVTSEIDHQTRMRIVYAAIIIFAFRATPSVGEGYRWFAIDVLGFDEGFYGVLQQLGAAIAIVAAWLLSDLITRKPAATVLLWLTVLGTILTLPSLALVLQGRSPDRAAVRRGRARYRPHRCSRNLAARAPEPHSAPHPHRRLCTVGAPRHLVRADGLADEPGADGRSARHQIPQPDLPRGPRRLCQSAGAADRGDRGRASCCRFRQSWCSDAACGDAPARSRSPRRLSHPCHS